MQIKTCVKLHKVPPGIRLVSSPKSISELNRSGMLWRCPLYDYQVFPFGHCNTLVAPITEIRTARSGLSSSLPSSVPQSNTPLVSCVFFFDALLHVLPTGRRPSLFRMH